MQEFENDRRAMKNTGERRRAAKNDGEKEVYITSIRKLEQTRAPFRRITIRCVYLGYEWRTFRRIGSRRSSKQRMPAQIDQPDEWLAVYTLKLHQIAGARYRRNRV